MSTLFIICLILFLIGNIHTIKRIIEIYKIIVDSENHVNRELIGLNEKIDNICKYHNLIEKSNNENFEKITNVLHTHELMIDKLENDYYTLHSGEDY